LTTTGSWLSNPPEGYSIKANSFELSPFGSFPAADVAIVADAEPSYFKASLYLDQLLFSWGKVEKAVKVASLELEAAKSATRKASLDIGREAAGAYFGAVLARDSLAPLQQARALFAEIVADRESAYAQGIATLQDALEARSRFASLAARCAAAEEGLATALAALEFYTGLRASAAELVTPPREALPALDEVEIAAALGSAPDIESLRARARQAALGEEISRASLAGLPDFFLRASYDLEGQGPPFAAGWEELYDYGLTVTLGGKATFFDSLSSQSRLEQAKARRRAAEAGAAELARSAALRARRLVDAARQAQATLDASRAASELAKERARNASTALENELTTRAEERGARIAALAAEVELAVARGALELALVEIESALERPLRRY
jgi:outer membrane protein TolC